MQPNNNRPVYIVQPSNLTPLNVRPTTIATGVQQFQASPLQQPIYQISTMGQSTIPQQGTPLYQIQPQTRFISPTPVYNALPTQRFTTSPQTILATNPNISPRPMTSTIASRMPIVASQPTTATLLRPTIATVSTPPMTTAASASTTTAQPAAGNSKDLAVRVPKSAAQYGIMEFANGLSIDVKDWKALEMRREINPFTYRPPSGVDPNSASSNTITTSLGVVLPKTGAGSEYGREQKEALKRKRYAAKGTNLEDLPWLLTDRSSSEKKLKHYRGMKKGGVASNSSYYVFIQNKDGFEAHPVNEWYAFTPTNVYKTLDFDEAEKQFQERHKNLNKWFLKHQITKEKDPSDVPEDGEGGEKGKKSKGKTNRDFKLLDVDDWAEDKEEEEMDDDDEGKDNDDDDKKSKTKKKNEKKVKGAWTLSDEEEEEQAEQTRTKKQKTTKRQTSEDHQGEDSDDGDHEGDEIEYTSDETSEEEDDIKDVGTVKAASKYEVRGVDEEVKTIPDIEKKLEQMDENGDELDLDDDDEEEDIPDIDENEDENKTAADDLSAVGNLLKTDALKEIESSSDDDDLDDSDDPDKETIEQIAAPINTQPIPSEQVKTEKGHKKAREEEMRAIKSKVMSLPSTPANPTDGITEDKVRNLLLRKQAITFTELIQVFLPRGDNLRTKEVKDGIVKRLAVVLKRLNIEEKMINGKKHIKLKST